MSNRLYSPTPRATCAAGRCQPGQCVCPCPQACELPADATRHARATQPTTPLRAVALRAAAGAAFVLAVFLLVFLASGA